MQSNLYLDSIIEKLTELKNQSLTLIQQASDKLVETVMAGHCVYIFGCTHAGILTEEAFYRTGGLAIFNPIFAPGLTVDNSPITITSAIERLDGYGKIIAGQSGLKAGDLLVIHSASGRNNVPVDLAIEARARGVYVICITSLAYSGGVESRHASGKRLFEVCDMVIDNLVPYGDAMVSLPRSGAAAAPASTVLSASILNAIVAEAAGRFDEMDELPPVFMSANIDRGDEYNKRVFEKYKDQIRYAMK